MKSVEFRRNNKGIIEVFKEGKYAGVIATTCSNPELEEKLFRENLRVRELREKGEVAEPKEW